MTLWQVDNKQVLGVLVGSTGIMITMDYRGTYMRPHGEGEGAGYVEVPRRCQPRGV